MMSFMLNHNCEDRVFVRNINLQCIWFRVIHVSCFFNKQIFEKSGVLTIRVDEVLSSIFRIGRAFIDFIGQNIFNQASALLKLGCLELVLLHHWGNFSSKTKQSTDLIRFQSWYFHEFIQTLRLRLLYIQCIISWSDNIIDRVLIEFILSIVARSSTFFQLNEPQISIIMKLLNPKIKVESRCLIDPEGIFVNLWPFLKDRTWDSK